MKKNNTQSKRNIDGTLSKAQLETNNIVTQVNATRYGTRSNSRPVKNVNSVRDHTLDNTQRKSSANASAKGSLKSADLANVQTQKAHNAKSTNGTSVGQNNFQTKMPSTRNARSISAKALAASRQLFYDREDARQNSRDKASTSTGADVKSAPNIETRNANLLANAKPSKRSGTSSSLYDAQNNARANVGANDHQMPSTSKQAAYYRGQPSTSSARTAPNIVKPTMAQPKSPRLSFTYEPLPNLDLYDDEFDVQERYRERGRDPNLPEFPPMSHYKMRTPSPCPLDYDEELDRLWRSDDELGPESVLADPDYSPLSGKKVGPSTPVKVKGPSTPTKVKSNAKKKRPRVVDDEGEGEEKEDNAEGTPKKKNVTLGGGDKMMVKIEQLNCSECEVTVTSLAAFNAHLLEVHGIKSSRCYVQGCGASFESKSEMPDHLRTVHGQLHQWPCCRCTKNFASYRTLREHQLTHQVGVFQCDTCLGGGCGFTASNRIKVYGHIRLIRKRMAKTAASGEAGEEEDDDSQGDSQEILGSQESLFQYSEQGSQEEELQLDDSMEIYQRDSQGDSQGDCSRRFSKQLTI